MLPLRFSLVGPGRVGTSLAHWARAAGAMPRLVAGRSPAAAARLAAELGGEPAALATLDTAADDLLLLAVSDAALPALAAALAIRPQARVVLHTSGAMGEEALAPLAAAGSHVGSVHPLCAFPRPLVDVAAARGTVFGLAGDGEAQEVARRLVGAWGGEAVAVPAAARPVYHLAASLAAGGVATLLAVADDLAARLGLPPAVARGYAALARGALAEAAAARPPITAVTGPAARGDAATLERELAALAAVAPELEPLAVELALATLAELARHAPLDEARERARRALVERRRRDP